MELLASGGVRHDNVHSPVDDVEEDERQGKDAPRDLVNTTSLSLADVRIDGTGLPPSPQVLQRHIRVGLVLI